MSQIAELLLTLGVLFVAAPWLQRLARTTRVPQVSLLLLLGVMLGPEVADLLPSSSGELYPVISEIALAMVGFLLGGEFTVARLRSQGMAVLWISVVVSLVTLGVVALGLFALGVGLSAALILATAATATDPAAINAVTRESGARGPTTDLLRALVAVDDVWGILLFGLLLAGLGASQSASLDVHALLHAGRELGGSLLVGGALGALAGIAVGQLGAGEATREEVLGFVLVGCGLASWLELSYLLCAVAMGTAFANVAAKREVAFDGLELFEQPILVVFFVLSGASAAIREGGDAWTIALAYIGLRIVGRVIGGYLGVRTAGGSHQPGVGLAMLPQAGVALGMTLVASERIPGVGAEVLPVIVLSTLAFELGGPLLTRLLLGRWGETGPA